MVLVYSGACGVRGDKGSIRFGKVGMVSMVSMVRYVHMMISRFSMFSMFSRFSSVSSVVFAAGGSCIFGNRGTGPFMTHVKGKVNLADIMTKAQAVAVYVELMALFAELHQASP